MFDQCNGPFGLLVFAAVVFARFAVRVVVVLSYRS